MKKNLLIVFFCISLLPSFSQEKARLSLQEAYNQAELHYPLLADGDIINALSEINLKLLNKQRLPTISLNGIGQFQTENVNIGEPGSPVSIDAPLESYKTYIDANFNLYDGGQIKAKKQIEEASLKANQQGLKVSLRHLKDRINSLFFVIELSRKQQLLLSTSLVDITTNISYLESKVTNGTVVESELSKLKVRKLELQSEDIKLKGDILAFFSVLNKLLGTSYTDNTILEIPKTEISLADIEISRPEQLLFTYQKDIIQAQEKNIDASRRPKISLFAQGGAGYPNPVNFADISNSTYALGGIRLNWNILDWGIAKNERAKLQLEKAKIEVDQNTFEFDIASRKQEFFQKITALKEQLSNDKSIVALQKDILIQTKTQLQEGVINANDYLIQVNAELAARQQLELHHVQLQQLEIDYLTLFGKL